MGNLPPLAFGMVRQQTATSSAGLFTELCDHLSRDLGTPVVAFLAEDYAELSAAVETGTVALAWLAPIPVVELSDRGFVEPVALPVRRGSAAYYAAFVVRRNGPRNIAELQGYRAAWVDRDSAAGYLVPRLHLAAQGIDVHRFFSDEIFLQTHFAVVDAVVTGRVDVGATFCTLDPSGTRTLTAGWTDAEGTSIRPVEVLTTMGPIPNDSVVAQADLPVELRTRVADWFAEPGGRVAEVLGELFHTQTFRAASKAHYDPLREIVRGARAREADDGRGRRRL